MVKDGSIYDIQDDRRSRGRNDREDGRGEVGES